MAETALDVLSRIEAELKAQGRGLGGAPGTALEVRAPSRMVAANASKSYVEQVAAMAKAGGLPEGYRVVQNPSAAAGGDSTGLLETMAKALAVGTDSAGGYLVDRDLADEIVKLIRARSAVMRLGPTIVPDIGKQLDVNAISTGATATWGAENSAIPVSEQSFAQTPLLVPKRLAGLVPASRKVIRNAVPQMEEVVRGDLAEVIALAADLAFLQGPGTGSQPKGIKTYAGDLTAAPSLGADGDYIDFSVLKTMVSNLREANAPFASPGWVIPPTIVGQLERIEDNEGRYLADTGLMTSDAAGGGGTLLGFPWVSTTQIPTNITSGATANTTYLVFSSDWAECWIGEDGGFELAVSTEASYTTDGGTTWVSAFQNDQALFRAITWLDMGLRRPKFFSVLNGIKTV